MRDYLWSVLQEILLYFYLFAREDIFGSEKSGYEDL